uniref:cellulase n=1 Tax=Timema californicum TaxID=61474 RepID=A0A7R9P8R1_TIMCA|nr:unnamed protein product [Timema californicum]
MILSSPIRLPPPDTVTQNTISGHHYLYFALNRKDKSIMLWPHLWLVAVPYVILVPLTTQAVDYDYERVLELSLLFYEAQRSGKLPSDNRVTWRGDSALEDRGQQGEDLTGGYYDGQFNHGMNALKWSADYFIKCHVSPNELYGQVGDFNLDHEFWGRPEELNMSRPAYKIDAQHPGSDLAGETAAALAAVSLVFRNENPKYADLCLEHARQLYTFASDFRGLYNEPIKGAAQYYENGGFQTLSCHHPYIYTLSGSRVLSSWFSTNESGSPHSECVDRRVKCVSQNDQRAGRRVRGSTDYGDELTWAAAWLYKATSESQYLDEAEHNYMKFRLKERPNEFFYNKKVAGVQMLLAELTLQPEYMNAVQNFCDFTVNYQKKTPKGLVYIDKFGTLGHAANVAFICLQVADIGISSEKYRDFVKSQIHYMLGDSGRSYVVGFGLNYPTQPYHAAR